VFVWPGRADFASVEIDFLGVEPFRELCIFNPVGNFASFILIVSFALAACGCLLCSAR